MEKWVETFIHVLTERKFGFKIYHMYFDEAINKLLYGKKFVEPLGVKIFG